MTHSMTLREGTQDHVTSRLRNKPTEPYGIHVRVPRFLILSFVLILGSRMTCLEWSAPEAFFKPPCAPKTLKY